MSGSAWGAALGGLAGTGLILLSLGVLRARRADFDGRVLAYVRDIPGLATSGSAPGRGAVRQVFGPLLQHVASRLERVLGGTTSVRRRIERADLPLTVHEFRVEQVIWGLVAFATTSAVAVLVALRSPERTIPLLILCLLSFVLGVLLRENRLSAQTRAHERRVLEELPAVAELLALAVAAGEGPVAALERVVSRSQGPLSRSLGGVLGEIRTGAPVGEAFDRLAARTGVAVVARFAGSIAVAVERGTPLADLLHAQATDVREAQRRSLIENGARREVLMMVPVVFLVLPTTVMFAFWPGVMGLSQVTP